MFAHRIRILPLVVILGLSLGGAVTGLAQTTEGAKQDQAPATAAPSAPLMGNSDTLEGGAAAKQDSETAPGGTGPTGTPAPPPQQELPPGPAGQQLPSMGSATSPLPSRGYLGQPRDKWNVFVLGDLLAEGVWSGLGRNVGDCAIRLQRPLQGGFGVWRGLSSTIGKRPCPRSSTATRSMSPWSSSAPMTGGRFEPPTGRAPSPSAHRNGARPMPRRSIVSSPS